MHLPRAHDERMAEAMTLDEDLARALASQRSERLCVAQNRVLGVRARKHYDPRASPVPTEFAVGARVLARFKRRDRFFPGVITAVNRDNCTVSVYYDDGDEEEDIREQDVKPEDRAQVFAKPKAAPTTAPAPTPTCAPTYPPATGPSSAVEVEAEPPAAPLIDDGKGTSSDRQVLLLKGIDVCAERCNNDGNEEDIHEEEVKAAHLAQAVAKPTDASTPAPAPTAVPTRAPAAHPSAPGPSFEVRRSSSMVKPIPPLAPLVVNGKGSAERPLELPEGIDVDATPASSRVASVATQVRVMQPSPSELSQHLLTSDQRAMDCQQMLASHAKRKGSAERLLELPEGIDVDATPASSRVASVATQVRVMQPSPSELSQHLLSSDQRAMDRQQRLASHAKRNSFGSNTSCYYTHGKSKTKKRSEQPTAPEDVAAGKALVASIATALPLEGYTRETIVARHELQLAGEVQMASGPQGVHARLSLMKLNEAKARCVSLHVQKPNIEYKLEEALGKFISHVDGLAHGSVTPLPRKEPKLHVPYEIGALTKIAPGMSPHSELYWHAKNAKVRLSMDPRSIVHHEEGTLVLDEKAEFVSLMLPVTEWLSESLQKQLMEIVDEWFYLSSNLPRGVCCPTPLCTQMTACTAPFLAEPVPSRACRRTIQPATKASLEPC